MLPDRQAPYRTPEDVGRYKGEALGTAGQEAGWWELAATPLLSAQSCSGARSVRPATALSKCWVQQLKFTDAELAATGTDWTGLVTPGGAFGFF